MKFKKKLSFLVSLLIFITSCVTFAQAEYATRGEVAEMLLQAADDYNPGICINDILKGYEDGLLHEERYVSRAEALVMLKRAFGDIPVPIGHNARVALTNEAFTDVPLWAREELEDVFNAGIVAGKGNGIFAPSEYVTKEQIELFISRVYSLLGSNERDDFYASVNKTELESMELLPGNPDNSVIKTLAFETDTNINRIIENIIGKRYAEGTAKQKVADFYKCVVDTKMRNKNGVFPIQVYLDSIDGANNIGELTLIHSKIADELFVRVLMEYQLGYDYADNTKYSVCFSTVGPLATLETYTDGVKKAEYINYVKEILILLGEDENRAAQNADAFYEFEKVLAENMLDARESSDVDKTYNVYSYGKICSLFPDFNMEELLKQSGLAKEESIIVTDTGLTEKFAEMYSQSNLQMLKTAMKIHLAMECGEYLNEDFMKVTYKYRNEIFGIDSSYSVEDQALSALYSVMDDYLAKIYVQEYFDEESKADVEKMTAEIIRVFKQRIENLSWMNKETKKKAIGKLDSINIKIGYPDSIYSPLDEVQILSPSRGGTYFNNMIKINQVAIKYTGLLQKNSTDRDMWLMSPYTVNAFYNPATNDITLPAAILQSPLYDKNSSYESNLGGIGFIIAHEITHAFDSNGALFDEKGTLNNWWSEEDFASFQNLCSYVVAAYNGREAVAGIENDGVLTLNENIADLGAMACITQIADEKGLDHKKMYTAFAKIWQNTSTREYASMLSKNDVHSDGKIRTNVTLMNTDKFYEVFGIKEGDGMYIPKESRVRIW